MNSVVFLLFWYGSFKSGNKIVGWDINTMTTYYLFLIIGGSTLIAHIEYDIAWYDIHEGGLVKFLIRPFPFSLFKFFEEIPYRLLQGFYGGIVVWYWILFVGPLHIVSASGELFLTLVIWILAFCLSFLFKLTISMLTFWFEEVWGLFQLCEVLVIILGGFTMPLDLMPLWMYQLSIHTPFAYMCYFPVLAISGKLTGSDWLSVIGSQLGWISMSYILYRGLWFAGMKKYTGVGQ